MNNLCKPALALVFLLSSSVATVAQTDPRSALAGTIHQLQTGTPNPAWYSPQLWMTIAQQTNNTGIYPQLVALGQVKGIVVNQSQQLPGGHVYSMTATHQNGISQWTFGIGLYPPRTEYANFIVGAAAANPEPLPKPPPGPPPEQPGPASESCKKFPNLCP